MNNTIKSLFPKIYEFISGNSIYRYNLHKLGQNSFLHRSHKITNPKHISIANNVTLEKDVWLNAIQVNGDIYGFIEIKNGANLGMRTTISSANRIIIHENVLMGMNILISDHEHRYEDINVPVMYQGIKGNGIVEIGRESWIGNNVVIISSKEDIKIGKHCIVGANSIIKHSIPDYSVVVGNPAKVVRQYNSIIKKWERVK